MRLNELHAVDFDLEKFESDCKPWLDMIHGASQPAYHGAHVDIGEWTIKPMKHRTKPRDTSVAQHDDANEFFMSKFGYPCRNWFFTSGSLATAKLYGKPFTIFPVGEVNYLWSPVIEDFAVQTEHFKHELAMQDRQMPFDKVRELAIDRMKEFIRQPGVWEFNKGIKQALKSGHEIMLDCKSFYMFEAMSDTYWHIVYPRLRDKGYFV